MSISTKILLPLLGFLILGALVSIFIGTTSLANHAQLQALADKTIEASDASLGARDHFGELEQLIVQVMAMTDFVDPAEIETRFKRAKAAAAAQLADLKAAALSADMDELTQKAIDQFTSWTSESEILLGLRTSNHIATRDVMVRRGAAIRTILNQAVSLAGHDARGRIADAGAVMRSELLSVFGLAAVLAGAGVAGAFWLAGNLARPLKRLAANAEKLAAGNVSVELGALHRRDEIGEIARAVETFRDNVKAQLQSQIELRALFDNASAGVSEMDAGTNRLLRINRVFCDLLGRDESVLLGGLNQELTHPDDRAEQARQWASIRETGQPFQCQRRYIRPDGGIVWAYASVAVAARDAEGRPARLVTIVHDITEQKAAEAALRASQELLHLSLDIGGVGTFRRDYGAGLIHCGRETQLMHGLPPNDEPIPEKVWLATVLPEDRARLMDDIAEGHAQRRPLSGLNYRFIHPDTGIRHCETRSRNDYDAEGRPLTSLGVVIDVTDRRLAEGRLAHLAHHDPLTDLPNRSLFRSRLDEALRQGRQGRRFALCYLDLDHFKEVNDTLGHLTGDTLLQAVTERLVATSRPTDTVARLGGDEFAIIQTPIEQPADAMAFAETLTATLGAPYEIEGRQIVIGTSIGITIVPDDGLDPDRLLRNADMALYAAKAAGRGSYRLFDPEMDERMQAKRALDADLLQALEHDAFELFYQPLVDVASRRLQGFEALLRWRHPVRGLVMPDTFIPRAEAIGLIVPIGAFVLHRACEQAMLWPGRLSVAVNLCAMEFSSPSLVDTVMSALRTSGLDPRRLELEITESTLLADTASTTETLTKLKALGVSISIDDFGTGFSSLSYLQRFSFDKVKIDRSFVSPLGLTSESKAIVASVVTLCGGLAMKTTAEGVETEAQLQMLARMGCDQAQGYYFSRPCPARDIPDLIGRLDQAALHAMDVSSRAVA